MLEEEQTLNPKPSEESEVIPDINTADPFAEPVTARDATIEERTSATSDYTTELVTSGPLSEIVRVYDLKDIDKILQKADELLYLAKGNGKNRLIRKSTKI